MNAKQMISRLDGYGGIIPFNSEELDITLRALRLLAAAEANDGKTPETDAAWEGLVLAATTHDRAIFYTYREYGLRDFQRIERERNGLAARVVELERIANTRAGRLLLKGKPFVVVANDEPYYPSVYAMIRQREQEVGRWSTEDESAYAAAIDAARGSKP